MEPQPAKPPPPTCPPGRGGWGGRASSGPRRGRGQLQCDPTPLTSLPIPAADAAVGTAADAAVGTAAGQKSEGRQTDIVPRWPAHATAHRTKDGVPVHACVWGAGPCTVCGGGCVGAAGLRLHPDGQPPTLSASAHK
eukprot:155231-Chlamydomonas_euryale.AAC.5